MRPQPASLGTPRRLGAQWLGRGDAEANVVRHASKHAIAREVPMQRASPPARRAGIAGCCPTFCPGPRRLMSGAARAAREADQVVRTLVGARPDPGGWLPCHGRATYVPQAAV